MAITDEDRSRLGDLAMRCIDDVIEQYGVDATLEDALLVYEVTYPDEEHEGEQVTEIGANTTTHRSTVAGGLAQAYALTQLRGWDRED